MAQALSNTPLLSEDQEQVHFVGYLEARGFKFTAIPNHTYTTSWKQKTHNKALGLRAGLCDLLVLIPNVGLVFIEMKRVKKSATSSEQQEWVDALNEFKGVAAHICKGAQVAIETIESYSPSEVGERYLHQYELYGEPTVF